MDVGEGFGTRNNELWERSPTCPVHEQPPRLSDNVLESLPLVCERSADAAMSLWRYAGFTGFFFGFKRNKKINSPWVQNDFVGEPLFPCIDSIFVELKES